MVEYVDGDVFKSGCDIVAHQVNCMGVMGAGVARQVASKYPNIEEHYIKLVKNTADDRISLLGYVQIHNTYGDVDEPYPKEIANMFGQYGCTHGLINTDYAAFEACCKTLSEYCKDRNESVAFPDHIGSDLGGGDWSIVKGIIEKYFSDPTITCKVCKYTPGFGGGR